ncbi:hypothetical protein B6N60_01789 [Richelia sinica FACHB-800]|uniref:Uncharacterized protein n=1 Tax=Richelia sinica FACHB-800 TaxID=1357546 RepID=A0A975Y4E5_9NOST|nr:hypothetical protein B6N60_01789 [Richelia sinica FACHB-800]
MFLHFCVNEKKYLFINTFAKGATGGCYYVHLQTKLG